MEYPKISIITPTFNAASTLEDSILSVLGQNYPNIEYIIIDGKSNDGTLDIIGKYKGRINYWISEPDNGIYDAMNKGIDVASGQWLYFLGADDKLCPGILNEVFGARTYPNISFLYGDIEHLSSGKRIGGEFSLAKLKMSNIYHQAIFYKDKVFQLLGKYSLKYAACADWDFNIKCFANEQIKKQHIEKVIAIYNEFGFSKTYGDPIFRKEKEKLIIQYLKKKISHKELYEILNDSVFNLVKYNNIFYGIKHLALAAYYTNKPFYYFKNGLYWLSQRFLNKQREYNIKD